MSSFPEGVPPHFVVFVPGYLGSKLRDKTTGQVIWGDFRLTLRRLLGLRAWFNNLVDKLKYPNDNIEPAGILDELLFIPPWAKSEQYGRMLDELKEMGYQINDISEEKSNVYAFAYDWRQDNRISARQLGEAIERWRTFHPRKKVWIIAHSNGGLVSRWYIEKEGGKEHVERLFMMGSPWDGTPKAMALLISGLDTMILRALNIFNISERTREMFRTFPSIYQLLPFETPFITGLDHKVITPYDDQNWLSNDKERQFMADAKHFNEELGTTPSVETLVFYGRQKPTTTTGEVSSAADGRWQTIKWESTKAGDGTIPTRSAENTDPAKNIQNLAFIAMHGDIYVKPNVLARLEHELIGKYDEEADRASLVTERLAIVFEPTEDIYSPGEEINLWATIHENEESAQPVSEAEVTVELIWRDSLPGSDPVEPPKDLSSEDLWESEEVPGRYEGSLVAPDIEGYYKLRATVQVTGEPTLHLEELILIEALPENIEE